MNHCFDCNSSYETPGTCNCFAPGGKRGMGPWTADGWVHPVLPEPVPAPPSEVRTTIHVYAPPEAGPDAIARQVNDSLRRASYHVLAAEAVA